ncbi:MAG: deoxyribose-phosphate aldolase [Clostridium sp.]|nr:deoxyribose-phosphate aldolase [Clostridium sp.]
MDRNILVSMIDHAALKPDDTDEWVAKQCQIALKYGVSTICVKPCHVAMATDILKDTYIKVSTVIGFPHGSTTTACKVFEANEAINNGALELDMVLNIGKLLSGDYDYVKYDIEKVALAVHERKALLKVIIETSLLTDEQKIRACTLAKEAGADFLKTSTGFNGSGATLKDISIMKGAGGEDMKIKASGGIKTFEQAVKFIEAGCSRIGTSSTISIAEGKSNNISKI